MDEKDEADKRAADASRAANEIRSGMERVLERADEVVRIGEQETEALKANAAQQAAARILADIDSKYCAVIAAGTWLGPSTPDDEPVRDRVVDTDMLSGNKMGTPETGEILVAEIHRRFDTAYEAVQAARAHAATVKTELERVRGEAAVEADVALRHERECSAASVAKVQRTARQQASVAANRVAVSEAALGTAKKEVEQLQVELRRAQATEAATRAAADEDKSGSILQIAQLEYELREAKLEHERSRQQSQSELEGLRETLERNEEAGRAAGTVQGVYITVRGDAANPSAAAEREAAVAAAMEGAIEDRRLQEQSMRDLRGAEEAVTEARKEVDYLRGELIHTAKIAATSKARQEAAETKLAELEVVLEGAIREHTLFRARAEDRLEALRATVEEDSQENRPQVRVLLKNIVL